jgi:hypothetical protein
MNTRVVHKVSFSLLATVLLINLPLRAQANLGMVGVKSVWGAYLQAHYPDGEMHSSNQHRNEEETWFLVEVDKANKLYALYNWRNGKFISHRGRCAPAASTILGPHEQWVMVSGKPRGFLNAVALKAKDDGAFLGGAPAGNDTECGGEVAAWDKVGTPQNQMWAGWWVFEPATTPSPGRDFWNTVGGAAASIANKITPADVAKFLVAVAAVL